MLENTKSKRHHSNPYYGQFVDIEKSDKTNNRYSKNRFHKRLEKLPENTQYDDPDLPRPLHLSNQRNSASHNLFNYPKAMYDSLPRQDIAREKYNPLSDINCIAKLQINATAVSHPNSIKNSTNYTPNLKYFSSEPNKNSFFPIDCCQRIFGLLSNKND